MTLQALYLEVHKVEARVNLGAQRPVHKKVPVAQIECYTRQVLHMAWSPDVDNDWRTCKLSLSYVSIRINLEAGKSPKVRKMLFRAVSDITSQAFPRIRTSEGDST